MDSPNSSRENPPPGPGTGPVSVTRAANHTSNPENFITAPGIIPKCVILDLDSTLIFTKVKSKHRATMIKISTSNDFELRNRLYRLSIDDVTADVGGARGEGDHSEMWGIERPNLKEFLRWCFRSFAVVGVWSAGKKPYVKAICQKIFLGSGIRSPHIMWTYNECNHSSGFPQKDLRMLVSSSEGQSLGLSLENTILIDDREESFALTPQNGILIAEYAPKITIEELKKPNTDLINLGTWLALSGYFYAPDVRIFLSSNETNKSEEKR